MARVAAFAAVVGLASVVGVVIGAAPASAELVCRNTLTGSVCVNVDLPTGTGGASGQGSGGGGSASPVYYYRTFVQGGQGQDEGETSMVGCWAIGATADPEQGGTYDEAMDALGQFVGNDAAYGACEADAVLDPAQVAGIYWERASSPPPPTPLEVAPGKALTGLPAYLVIGGDNPFLETHATPLGTLTFTMTPRYVVDWGDGATAETRTQGVPYPGGAGEITHTYTDVGSVTITVTAYWSATWQLAGDSGDLPELAVPTEASLGLPIEQRQAVIDG